MAIVIIFVAILWQFYGEKNRFYCNFMAKTKDFFATLWQKQSFLLQFHGEKKKFS